MSGRTLEIAKEAARRHWQGGFSTLLNFTPKTGDPFSLRGFATVHSQGFDSDGLPMISDNSHISFMEPDVNELGYVTRDAKGNINLIDWRVTFDHTVGTVSAVLTEPEPDSTLGVIRIKITGWQQ